MSRSIAFGKNGDLWAVNIAIGPPDGPGSTLLRLEIGVKGQPLPSGSIWGGGYRLVAPSPTKGEAP